MTQEQQDRTTIRSISIPQWCALVREGAAPSVTIHLDGDSMRPLVRRNRDYVTIQPLNRPLKLGDVVLFQNQAGQYVVHRVWKLRYSQVQTLGDNCWNPDPWISTGQVLGLAAVLKRGQRVFRLDRPLARGVGRVWLTLRPLRNLWRRGKHLVWRSCKRLFMRGR